MVKKSFFIFISAVITLLLVFLFSSLTIWISNYRIGIYNTANNSSDPASKMISGENGASEKNEYTLKQRYSKYIRVSSDKIKGSKKVILSLHARVYSPELTGSDYALKVIINGDAVTKSDLINKAQIRNYTGSYPYQYTHKDGDRGNWYSESRGDFKIFDAHNYSSNNLANNRYRILGGEATLYEFDIKKYLTETDNLIVIYNSKSSNYNLKVKGIQIWKQMTDPASYQLKPGDYRDTTVYIDRSKKYALRLFGKLDNDKLAGAASALKMYVLDNTTGALYHTFSASNIMNKPQNADDYSGKLIYTYNNRRKGFYVDNHHRFTLFFSPNFSSNNLSRGRYGIIGGEAYQYDLKIPAFLLSQVYKVRLSNVSASHSLTYKDLSLYEIIDY